MRGISIVILLVVVALGALLGFAWWSGAGRGGAAATAGARVPEAAPRAAAELDFAAAHVEPERPARPVAEREAVAAPSPESFGELDDIADEPLPDAPRVVGRVVDVAGRPIAEALVLAAARSGWTSLPLDSRGMESGLEPREEATTGADGAFEITGLQPGVVRIAVRAAGFAPLDLDELTLPVGERHELGDLTLSRGVVLAGRVVDAAGAGVADATILRWTEDDWGRVFFGSSESLGAVLANTAEDGGFRIDVLIPGAWSLLVESAEHPTKTFTGELGDGELARTDLVLQLDPPLAIRGRVESADGSAVAGLIVRGTDISSVRDGRSDGPRLHEECEVQADGSFELRGLRDATYHVRPHRGDEGAWGRSWAGDAVQVRAGTDGVVLRVGASAPVRFRLVDAVDGSCIDECEVTLQQHTRSMGLGMTVPDGNLNRGGADCLWSVDASVLRADLERLDVRIESPGYVTWDRDEVELVDGAPVDLGTIALERAPAQRFRVVDGETDLPVAGARVHLSGETERLDADGFEKTESFDHTGRTDERGLVTLYGVPGVTHRARADAAGHAPSPEVEVVPGTGGNLVVELRLGAGGTITARVVDPRGDVVPGADVRRRLVGDDEDHGQTTDAAGEAVFEDLRPGTHEFWLAKHDAGDFVFLDGRAAEEPSHVQVEIAAGESRTVDLVGPATCELAGTVREAGAPLPGARVWLEEAEPVPNRFSMSGRKEFETRTDGRGRYRLERVRAGEWVAWIEHPGRAMDARREIVLADARERLDVDLAVSIVEGRVVDTAGEPVAGARVRIESTAGDGPTQVIQFAIMGPGDDLPVMFDTSPTAVEVVTDTEGRFRFRGVRPDVDLVAHASGPWIQDASSEPFQVVPDGVRSGIEIEVARAGSVLVRVTGPGVSPGSWMNVALEYQGDGEPDATHHGSGITTVEHRFEGVAPGPWRATLDGTGDEDEGPLVRIVEVAVDEQAVVEFQVP